MLRSMRIPAPRYSGPFSSSRGHLPPCDPATGANRRHLSSKLGFARAWDYQRHRPRDGNLAVAKYGCGMTVFCHRGTCSPCSRLAGSRTLSSTSMTASGGSPSSPGVDEKKSSSVGGQTDSKHTKEKERDSKKTKDDDGSNIFLDNMGKIFLATIGGVVLMLIRSSYGTSNRTAERDRIETLSVLDPLEIDDLRVANSELTPDVWDEIVCEVRSAFPSGRARYVDFVSKVIQVMRGIKGEAFTVQLGHLLDRVVVAAMEDAERDAAAAAAASGRDGTKGTSAGNDGDDVNNDAALKSLEESGSSLGSELPLSQLFAILSLALNSGVKDRVKALFGAMKHESASAEEGSVLEDDVVRMVQYLQQSGQLVPDAQVVLGDAKYPVQQYRRGTPRELVAGAKKTMVEDGTKKGAGGNGVDRYDETEFHRLLRTKSVCAWGECYVKKRGLD